jgi:hypothetical protein
MKLTMYYRPGPAVSDFVLEATFKSLLHSLQERDVTLVCSTENLFTRVRVGIVQGDISHTDVLFRWQGLEFQPDKNGRIDHWPEGFLDTTERLLSDLL